MAASPHCLPSPNGRLVATLLATGIHVRAVARLDEIVCMVALPAGISARAVIAFQWSPSSRRVLVATAEQILVATVGDEDQEAGAPAPFRALVRNTALSAVGKPALVAFGADEDKVCLCSALGIAFAIYNLRTGKTIEIANPKLYSTAAVCRRGFGFRPSSHHLALLTRTAGKDWVSVHEPTSAAVRASWAPDTIDAQGLLWSPDGRWLVVWESPAHGHKMLFYTPDGHLFKVWTGGFGGGGDKGTNDGVTAGGEMVQEPSAVVDESLGSGIRLALFSPNARLLAVGDASRCIRVLDMASTIGMQKLVHPTTLVPNARLKCKVWQEQILSSAKPGSTASASHSFVEALQAISPPGRSPPPNADAPTGCSLLSFDRSSAYLVTRLDEAPSTVWIWDAKSSQLRAVLMFHGNVSSAVWHDTRPRTLLIACDGDKHRSVGFVWHGPAEPPTVADFSGYLLPVTNGDQPSGNLLGKCTLSWLHLEGHPPCLFCSDGKEFALASLPGDEAAGVPWQMAMGFVTNGGQRRLSSADGPESPLELVPADIDMEDADSELEDTFLYKRDD